MDFGFSIVYHLKMRLAIHKSGKMHYDNETDIGILSKGEISDCENNQNFRYLLSNITEQKKSIVQKKPIFSRHLSRKRLLYAEGF